jgi:hypothetical protein
VFHLFREFGVVKTLEKFEKLLNCRKTPARFFNCKKPLVEKPRLDPDSSMLKVFEKNTKLFAKVHKLQEDPCSIFLPEKKHFAFKSGSRPSRLDPEPLVETV